MRRILLALLIIYAPAAWAQIGPSNYPAATVPLNGVDAVLLDQGSGCATHVAPCTTSQAASTRIGQPVQRTTAPTSPFQYQQWIDTSLSPPKLKEFIGSTWFVIANLDPTNGFSFTIPSTSVTGLGTMSMQNAVAVAITGGTITGMPTPTNGGDVASKSYVDSVATALVPQTAVKYATAAILPNTPTYNNGASGVGATLTAGSNTTLTVDGNVAGINDRVLVKNQADQTQNGCYAISQVGSGAAPWVLTRCIDWDQSAEMKQNSYFFTSSGSVNAATSWFSANGGITVGSSAIVFQQFSASNVYSASTGLTLGGSAFSITATGVTATSYGTATQVPTITVNAQGQITTASNTSISIPATQITSGLLSLARGGTAADLTATGGTSQVLRQSSAGAAITVGQIGASDLSNGTFSGNVSALSGTVSALNFQIGSSATTDAGTVGFLGSNGPGWQFFGSASAGAGLAQLITGGSVRMLINSAGALRLVAYGAGILATDGSGNVSATATTGTGAVMLADSPTSTGTLTANVLSATTLYLGGRLFANTGGVYNVLADGAGNQAIYLGSGGDPTNYYRNTAHVFGNIGGGTVYATLNGTGVAVGTSAPLGNFDVKPAANQHFLVRGNLNLGDGVSIYSVNDANSLLKSMEFGASAYYLAGGPLRLGAGYTTGVLFTDVSGNVTNIGTTGTGAVMLAASPTTTGTLTAATITASGNVSALNYQIASGATTDAGTVGFFTSNGPGWQFYGSASAGAGQAQLLTGGSARMVINNAGALRLIAYGAGVLTTDGSGNVSATATTGTGAVMLANSPTSTGTLTAATINAVQYNLSGVALANTNGTHNILYDGSSRAAIFLGGTGDPTNYYRNTTHYFQSIGGAATFVTIDAAGLQAGTGTFVNTMSVAGAGACQSGVQVCVGTSGSGLTGAAGTLSLITSNLLRFQATDTSTTTYVNAGFGSQVPTHQVHLSADDGFKPGGGTWGNSSDARLKTNVVADFDAMAQIRLLNPVLFDWKDPALHASKLGVAGQPYTGGFLAQDIRRVFPDFVSEADCQGTDCAAVGGGKVLGMTLPFKFDAYLVRAMQQLDARLTAAGIP